MSYPKVSVCIPVYNCERFIGEAIESVLKQSFKDFELLVIDNCSTDKTVEVIKAFRDERIHLIQNETNVGMLGNWNKCVAEARGEFIKLLPADDFIYPGSLERQYKVLEKDTNKRIAVVCGRKNVINDSGKVLFTRGFSNKEMEIGSKKAINRIIAAGSNILGEPGAIMFRKEIIEKTGPFVADIFYVLDLNMWMKMLLHGNLYTIPEPVSAFRISPVSESIKQISTQKRDVDRFLKTVYENKSYQVSTFSYYRGLLNSFTLAQAKKLIYKFVL